MWPIQNTSPTWWHHVMRLVLVSVVLFGAACTASWSPQLYAFLIPCRGTARPEYPTPDWFLTRGDIQVVKTHLHQMGFDPGPVDGLFTAQRQAAVRAFQA
jgi:hypothetical protein